MKLLRIVYIFVLLSCSCHLAAAEQQKIVLNDKSVLYGEVLEMANGVYTIKTSSFGTVKVEANNIQSIKKNSSQTIQQNTDISISDSPSRRKQNSKPDMAQTEVNSRVMNQMSDGDFLNDMLNISSDDTMTNVMSDPDVMEAISNNDYEFLMNNDKMNNLMNSSGIKNLLGNFE